MMLRDGEWHRAEPVELSWAQVAGQTVMRVQFAIEGEDARPQGTWWTVGNNPQYKDPMVLLAKAHKVMGCIVRDNDPATAELPSPRLTVKIQVQADGQWWRVKRLEGHDFVPQDDTKPMFTWEQLEAYSAGQMEG